jgi:hypothetical protein
MAPPSVHPLLSSLEQVWEECLDIPRAHQILEGPSSHQNHPGTPGAANDLGISKVDMEFLNQRFIDEL